MSRWNLKFILETQSRGFRAGMRQAERAASDFGKTQRKEFKKTKLEMESLRSKISVLGSEAAEAAIIFAVVGKVFLSTAKAASHFQKHTIGLSALMKTSESKARDFYLTFEKMNKSISEFAPSIVVDQMKKLSQAGFSQMEIMRDLPAILDTVTASMGQLTVRAAVDLGVNLHRGFSKAGQGMRELLDVAVAGANQFPMSVGQIADAMGYATEAAVTHEQSLSSVITTLGMLMPVTKTASKAGTAYRNALLTLTKTKSVDFLKKHNIKLRDQAGRIRDLLDVYRDLDRVIDKIREKDKKEGTSKAEVLIREIGGVRGGAMFASMNRIMDIHRVGVGSKKGSKFLDKDAAVFAMQMKLIDAAGATGDLASRMRKASDLIDKKFSASIERASVAVGEVLAPTVDMFKDIGSGILNWFAEITRPISPLASQDRLVDFQDKGTPEFLGNYMAGEASKSLFYMATFGVAATALVQMVKKGFQAFRAFNKVNQMMLTKLKMDFESSGTLFDKKEGKKRGRLGKIFEKGFGLMGVLSGAIGGLSMLIPILGVGIASLTSSVLKLFTIQESNDKSMLMTKVTRNLESAMTATRMMLTPAGRESIRSKPSDTLTLHAYKDFVSIAQRMQQTGKFTDTILEYMKSAEVLVSKQISGGKYGSFQESMAAGDLNKVQLETIQRMSESFARQRATYDKDRLRSDTIYRALLGDKAGPGAVSLEEMQAEYGTIIRSGSESYSRQASLPIHRSTIESDQMIRDIDSRERAKLSRTKVGSSRFGFSRGNVGSQSEIRAAATRERQAVYAPTGAAATMQSGDLPKTGKLDPDWVGSAKTQVARQARLAEHGKAQSEALAHRNRQRFLRTSEGQIQAILENSRVLRQLISALVPGELPGKLQTEEP